LDYSTTRVTGASTEDRNKAISVAAWKTIKYIYKDVSNSASVAASADALLLAITGLSNPSSTNLANPVGLGLRVAYVQKIYMSFNRWSF
jgi:hypothetical protein